MPPSLKDELKKRSPFASAAQEALLQLWRTSDQLQNRFGRLFREHGITSSQYNVLRILRGEGTPLPSLEIAGRMIQQVPAITGLIDRLEQQGFAERRRCPEDRRVVHVAITDAGLKLLARLDQPVQSLHDAALKKLSKSELLQLSQLLEKICSSPDNAAASL